MELGLREGFQVGSLLLAIAAAYYTMRGQVSRLISDIIKLSKCMSAAETRIDLAESSNAVFAQQLAVLSEINSPTNLDRRSREAAATEAHITALQAQVAALQVMHNGKHKATTD